MADGVADDFEEAELQTIRTLGSDAQVGENKKTSILVAIFGIFEVVEG